MRKAALVSLFCLCATAGLATAASDQLTFRDAGFSIAPLEGSETLMMVLPASDGFAASVNVQIQHYPGALDDYVSLSKEQFRQMGMKVLSERKKGPSGWLVEYMGDMGGRSLHWYAHAELRKDKVYLATATATKRQWPSLSSKLKICIDSLTLTG